MTIYRFAFFIVRGSMVDAKAKCSKLLPLAANEGLSSCMRIPGGNSMEGIGGGMEGHGGAYRSEDVADYRGVLHYMLLSPPPLYSRFSICPHLSRVEFFISANTHSISQ